MKLIVYGDIHGCYNNFTSLRKKINPKKNDIEVCVGDIITKGEDSIKVLKYIQEHDIKSVLGNHEDKLVRYLEHKNSEKKNPIVLNNDEKKIIENLDNEDIEYLKNMPLFLKFKGGKGVSTIAGILLAVSPLSLLAGGIAWGVVFYSTRYVSLASIAGALTLPISAFTLSYYSIGKEIPLPSLIMLTSLALLAVIRHKGNIVRLLNGTENRFVKKNSTADKQE
jgi:hypothetical protein